MAQNIQRNSNFELLRIYAILAIIGYHFYSQNAIFNGEWNMLNHSFVMILGSFGRTGVNVFVIIGAWFLLEQPFKSMRVIRLYLTCLVYTVLITLGVVLVYGASGAGADGVFKNMLRAITPFSSSPLWFISDYIFLLVLTPFLNTIQQTFSREKYRVLIWVLIVIFVGIPTVESMIPGFAIYKYYIVKSDMTWLIALYLILGYWKKYPVEFLDNKKYTAIGTAILVIGCAMLCFVDVFLQSRNFSNFAVKKFHTFLEYLFTDISSVFCFLLAVCLFFLFRQMTFSSKMVNWISRSVLGIYILHQVPVLIPHLWSWCHIESWMNSPFFLFYEIFIISAIFLVGMVVDGIRQIVMRPLFKMPLLVNFSKKWDDIFNV